LQNKLAQSLRLRQSITSAKRNLTLTSLQRFCVVMQHGTLCVQDVTSWVETQSVQLSLQRRIVVTSKKSFVPRYNAGAL